MSQEFLDHIFDPFVQEKNDARSVSQGTGLGMTIVKGLIAVVFILYDRMTAQDIIEFDVRPWFEKMALTQHLTPSRSQGLEAMIRAIRAKAANIS